jgi:hypothetical protein
LQGGCEASILTYCHAAALLQEQTLRSTSLQFELAAGPVSSAALQAAGADQETLTISNGKDPQQR